MPYLQNVIGEFRATTKAHYKTIDIPIVENNRKHLMKLKFVLLLWII